MPYATTDDGVRLYFEDVGLGDPVFLIHEFGGDVHSWDGQVRALSRHYRCVRYAARGYAPSDVPGDENAYSQDRAVKDAVQVLEQAGLSKAHVIGLSMGAFCALNLALSRPDLVTSLVLASIGYGAAPSTRTRFQSECVGLADAFESEPQDVVSARFNDGAARIQLKRKDIVAWEHMREAMATRSAAAAAATIRRVQMIRPTFYDYAADLAEISAPTLIMAGDEDWGCVEPSLFLRSQIGSSGLAIFPKTGHTMNLEEPARFNEMILSFLGDVEHDAWPRSEPKDKDVFMWNR
jgi:pimeloyl-ACP methyl ester carboxylesterase